jgi:UDP-glucose 4-epimerase
MNIPHLGTVLVTGGAGAIGSRLVRRLLASGATRVIVIDDLSSGYEWLLPNDCRLTFVEQDVCDLAMLRLNIREPLVFHLAAFFANQNSVDHPFADLHTNGKGTLAVLTWAAQNNAHRVVYASAGCSIAGHGIDAPIREDMPVSLHLDTPYQITKALGEFYCNYFNQQVSTVRCRFFNSYGPGEVPGRYRNVIPNFIWSALNNERLVITGTGEETRDFIFVEDLVEGLMLAATHPDAAGGAFNLGTGIQTDILTLANTIVQTCNSKSRIEFATRRPWDNSPRRQADISQASSVLGLNPKVNIQQGIQRTVEWFVRERERIEASIHAAV